LDEAIEMEDNKIIELLLEYGVDLTQQDNNYNSFRYAIEKRNDKLIKLLLEKGGDINKPDEKGNLIINVALNEYYWPHGGFSIFKLLIENGMNINVDTSFYNNLNETQTPLMYVIYKFEDFRMDVIDYILDLKELDINYSINDQKYAYPKTVLDAVQSVIKHNKINSFLDSDYKKDYEEIKNKLLETGAKTGEELFSNEEKLIKNNYDLINSIEYPDGYDGDMNLSIITIPKGTILFRKSKDINSDYCGIPQKDNKNNYATHKYHNVFFYFYPFYSDSIDATSDEMTNKMFYLTKDIQLLNLTYPSKANRGDKHNSYYENIFKPCKEIDIKLKSYDPCLTDYFIEDFPDVMGMLAIARTDANDHIKIYYNKNNSEKDEALFYSVLWKDSEIIGSPEIILHPFQKRIIESYGGNGLVQSIENCKKLPKNYELLEESNTENSIVSMLNEYLRPKGKNNKHITIFSPLKLFVLYEELDDKYKKSCVPLVMSIKSKLQTFQITDKDDMVPFHRVDINPDTNRTFNETIFNNTRKRGGKKGKKTHKNNKRPKKNGKKTCSKKQKGGTIFTPTTKEKLKDAVMRWVDGDRDGLGNISEWNTSEIKDMSNLFYELNDFNEDISRWDVSNVENMEGMFNEAKNFNQPIGNWKVSMVTNMRDMFNAAKAFNQPIGGWDVSKVKNMDGMFMNAITFNQPIGDWNVSSVINMELMFYKAKAFNQPIGNWNVSNVTNMDAMFWVAKSFNQPIGDWDVSKVTNMTDMFNGAIVFNQDIGDWDVSKVPIMTDMFNNSGYKHKEPNVERSKDKQNLDNLHKDVVSKELNMSDPTRKVLSFKPGQGPGSKYIERFFGGKKVKKTRTKKQNAGKNGRKTHKNNKRLKKNEPKTRSKKKRSRKNKK
jgi:surface protein